MVFEPSASSSAFQDIAGPMTIVAGLLLLALCAHYIAPASFVAIFSFCCMSLISKEIPDSRVVSYQLSNRSISPKAGVM
ncbi:C-C motif chemokine 24 [Molossus nigricans]